MSGKEIGIKAVIKPELDLSEVSKNFSFKTDSKGLKNLKNIETQNRTAETKEDKKRTKEKIKALDALGTKFTKGLGRVLFTSLSAVGLGSAYQIGKNSLAYGMSNALASNALGIGAKEYNKGLAIFRSFGATQAESDAALQTMFKAKEDYLRGEGVIPQLEARFGMKKYGLEKLDMQGWIAAYNDYMNSELGKNLSPEQAAILKQMMFGSLSSALTEIGRATPAELESALGSMATQTEEARKGLILFNRAISNITHNLFTNISNRLGEILNNLSENSKKQTQAVRENLKTTGLPFGNVDSYGDLRRKVKAYGVSKEPMFGWLTGSDFATKKMITDYAIAHLSKKSKNDEFIPMFMSSRIHGLPDETLLKLYSGNISPEEIKDIFSGFGLSAQDYKGLAGMSNQITINQNIQASGDMRDTTNAVMEGTVNALEQSSLAGRSGIVVQ